MLKEGKGPSKLDIKKTRWANGEGLVPGFVLPVESEPKITETPEPAAENKINEQLHDVMQRLNLLTDNVEEIKDKKKKKELLKLIDDRCAKLKLYEREAEGEKTTALINDFEALVFDLEKKLEEVEKESRSENNMSETEFKEGLKQIKTREELLAYLESLGKTVVRGEKKGSIFFPAYISEVKKSLEGKYELDWKTMREKIREIMGNKETEKKKKISFEEFKEKYKDVWKENLFDEKREKWIFIQDYDEEKGAWVRFGEGTKYLKPKHVPLDELGALLQEYKNKEEKIKKDDSAGRAEKIKSAEKQMEEADRKVYKEYADKFYLKLSDEKTVNWAGYTAEQKVETLDIQTLVFLQKELSQNPKYKDRAEKLAREIFEGK